MIDERRSTAIIDLWEYTVAGYGIWKNLFIFNTAALNVALQICGVTPADKVPSLKSTQSKLSVQLGNGKWKLKSKVILCKITLYGTHSTSQVFRNEMIRGNYSLNPDVSLLHSLINHRLFFFLQLLILVGTLTNDWDM